MLPHSLVETDTGRFAYIERGDPRSPLVLCLHGFPDHALSYVPVMDHLAAAGYRAVAPWMRGYFPSVLAGPYDGDSLARDVIALADALSPNAPISLVGHDWGAVVSYPALAAAPERFRCAVTMSVPHPRAFIANLARTPRQLLRSWYMLFFQLPRVSDRSVRARQHAFVRRLWRIWSPGYDLPEPEWQALESCLAQSESAPLQYYRAMFRARRETRQTLRDPNGMRIAVPVRYLHGEHDGCISADMGDEQERYYDATFESEIVRGAGHFLQLERPTNVADRIVDWLGRWH